MFDPLYLLNEVMTHVKDKQLLSLQGVEHEHAAEQVLAEVDASELTVLVSPERIGHLHAGQALHVRVIDVVVLLLIAIAATRHHFLDIDHC